MTDNQPAGGSSHLTRDGAEQIVRDGHARFDLSSGSLPLTEVGLSQKEYTNPVTTDVHRPFTVDFVGASGTFTVQGSTLHAMTVSTKPDVQTIELYQAFPDTPALVEALERDGDAAGVPSAELDGLVESLRATPDAPTRYVTKAGESLGFAVTISVRIPEDKPGRTLVYSVTPADVWATYPKTT